LRQSIGTFRLGAAVPSERVSGDASTIGLVGRNRVADQIIDTLRDGILTGRFPQGSRLPAERELASGFGVSTPTVRESLRALASMGLVEIRHGSGTYVRTDLDTLIGVPLAMLMQLENVSLGEVIGLLQVLNMYAADLAVDAATGEDVNLIRLAAQRTAESRTEEEVQSSGPAFLVALSDASHQPLVAALCRFLTNMLVRLEAATYSPRNAAAWRKWVQGTAPTRLVVADALSQRDRAGVQEGLRTLHEAVSDRITPAMRKVRLSDQT
jgi:DNA-binding FadR family transcriptional regulator